MGVTHAGWAQVEAGIPGSVSVLAGLFKMGPLPLDLASLIARTHLQRSAEAQIMGQRVSMSSHTEGSRRCPMGWRD